MTESTTTDITSLLADGTAAGNWVLDSAGSHAEFGVKHFWGAITVRGTFERMTGEATVGPDGTVTGRISFDAASLNTKNKQRDKHLRSADFFDVESYPKLSFESTRIDGTPDDFTIDGKLTIHGVTRDVSLAANFEGRTKDPWGGTRIGYSAHTTINRKDYGLTWNAALETGGVVVGDEVRIELNVEAILQQ